MCTFIPMFLYKMNVIKYCWYLCKTVAGSCEEWKELGLLDSTSVEIAPTSDTFWAFCNMEGIDGNVVTEICMYPMKP